MSVKGEYNTKKALTEEEYELIIEQTKKGSKRFRPNKQMAVILQTEGNLGMRIEDILRLKMSDIIEDEGKHRLKKYTEKKTGKPRKFIIPEPVYRMLYEYQVSNNISDDEPLFTMKERSVSNYLNKVASYLGIENVGTHSFRKRYARQLYYSSGKDVELVRQALNHSSLSATIRYLGIADEQVNDEMEKIVKIL